MNLKKIIKLYKRGNVCVCGLRGTGKDMLTANVIIRRKRKYMSNVNYGGKYIPLDFSALDVGNSYKNFINNDVNRFIFPYEKCDIYVSDGGIYFPCQYNSQLNKEYEGLAVFQALSRQLGNCNFHLNVQSLNRVWDKIREQSDTYLLCNWCKVLFGKIVIQKVTLYERYDSCLNRVRPNRVRRPSIFTSKEVRQQYELYCDKFDNENGRIKSLILIYVNKSNYDTRLFKYLLSKYSNAKVVLNDENT